ncbi:MAG: hypothetical protein Q9196_007117, partial [Gyalolechia fulgens]
VQDADSTILVAETGESTASLSPTSLSGSEGSANNPAHSLNKSRSGCADALRAGTSCITYLYHKSLPILASAKFYYQRPIVRTLFAGLCLLAIVLRSSVILKNNRYASDDILYEYAAQLYDSYTNSLPQLYTHILPTLAFDRMFEIKQQATLETARIIREGRHPCRTVTEERTSSLVLPLERFSQVLKQLDDASYTYVFHVPHHANFTVLCKEPILRLDQAIRLTQNRSHFEEFFINAFELFDLEQYLSGTFDFRGINSYGLKALKMYTVDVDKDIKRVLRFLEAVLPLLMSALDLYNDLFKRLDDMGLSPCSAALEQSLGANDKVGEGEDESPHLLRMLKRGSQKHRPPVSPFHSHYVRAT